MNKKILLLLILSIFIFIGCNEAIEEENTEVLEELEEKSIDENNNEDNLNYEEKSQDDNEKETSNKEEDKEETSVTKQDGELEVHFINVGQGDAVLIKSETETLLIDGGNRGNDTLNYLKNHGVDTIDLIIATHPHADHIGGLINVMGSLPVKEVFDSGVVHTTKTFEDYLTVIDEKNILFTEARTGMIRDFDSGMKLEILHPNNPSANHLNDSSVVARITFGEISFLFTGDAEESSEKEMISRGENLKSNILKVGHHGSRTSTTNSFLEKVNPDIAIMMLGDGNTYGHPHNETVEKLNRYDVKVFRTDINGSIVVNTDGISYSVSGTKDSSPVDISSLQGPSEGHNTDDIQEDNSTGSININTALKSELEGIIHIGPAYAEQIINLRPFNSVDDLTRVNGIGDGRLRDIKEEGKAYAE